MVDYDPLRDWLKPQRQTVTVTFTELEGVLGCGLPASARKLRQWWENNRCGHSQTVAWLDAGWQVQTVNLITERVTFEQLETTRR